MSQSFWAEIGLGRCGKFYRDSRFLLAAVSGVAVWLAAWLLAPQFFGRLHAGYMLLLSVIVWQPLLEELLFRGVIQGQMALKPWGKAASCGISRANLLASILFALSHLVYHAPAWAAAVLAPSLVFGYFRDRYGSVWPGLALHVFYNAGYFLIGEIFVK